MPFSKVFFMNISLLISLAYLMNVGYKYILSSAPRRVKFAASVVMFIFAGWLTMVFGLQIGENVLFDLRIVPLITAIFVYTNPLFPALIGIGIGLARFTLGMNEAAMAGFINLTLLGILAAALNAWYQRKPDPFWRKVGTAIIVMNVVNVVNISIFGVLDLPTYLLTIVPKTLPLSLALSCLFMFFLRDFYVEMQRMLELRRTNDLLEQQAVALLHTKSALEDKAKQLEQASQYKSEFLANMSHELKTPLNSIILLSQLMLDRSEVPGHLSEEDRQYVQMMHSSGKELLQLINDILDLSKVEAGKMDILDEIISVQEIPQILYHQFLMIAQQKGVAFEIHMEPGLPELLRTDGMRVHQILKNLLSNAFKFTHEGKVTLELKRMKTAPDELENGKKEWLAISVIDTGIGIAEDKQMLIFHAFQQGDGSIHKQYGGTGLGLSISRQLAVLLGGALTVESKLGEGSRFTLLLPIDDAALEREGEQDIFMKV
ncbi:ATP-binding protein [Paenibacillus sp. GD4]|jgi:signal transduction histidine kinase|uniref:sensor histidine kinase n=1 Tax=Paenibacillus sp. GD4 TaxID=3068890 RepID=UPI002796BE45|nr:ATP-binding protein [Paenibacillus sp. GD4]MDQ1911480.1 ATP-binding protein [Paenibacillus sp. GD4]